MADTPKKTGRMILRLALTAAACIGLYTTLGENSAICYYTTQSNIWSLCVTLAAIIMDVLGVKEREWFKVTRFVVTVGIMVTFSVFWAMLAPTMPGGYLLGVSSLTLHFFVPLLTLFDTLLFDGYVPTKKQVLFSAIPPLYYFCFAMILAEVPGVSLADGSRYPYWFLNADRLGWFGFESGPGVFYWVLAVVVIVLGLGYFFRFLKKARLKKQRTEENGV